MRMPDEVAAMQRLHELGWGTRRIAEIGCNRETVQRYVDNGVTVPVLAIVPVGVDLRQAVRAMAPGARR